MFPMKRNFLLCHSCFWCTSYFQSKITFTKCPYCIIAAIVKLNVCLLVMRKNIVSTVVLREVLNSFFPPILSVDSL